MVKKTKKKKIKSFKMNANSLFDLIKVKVIPDIVRAMSIIERDQKDIRFEINLWNYLDEEHIDCSDMNDGIMSGSWVLIDLLESEIPTQRVARFDMEIHIDEFVSLDLFVTLSDRVSVTISIT